METNMKEKVPRFIEIPPYVAEEMCEIPEKSYCYACDSDKEYVIKKRKRTRMYREMVIEYVEEYAECAACGSEIYIEYIFEKNEKEFERISQEQYSKESIRLIKLMEDKYNVGKRPLSKALGLGELTVTRIVEGSLPSAKNYLLLKEVATNYNKMLEIVNQNENFKSEGAYKKVLEAIQRNNKYTLCEKLIDKISLYLLIDKASKYEISNLSLQKLLYYIKGFGYAFYNRDIIGSSCEAWVHGPVFSDIYEKYKDFKGETIELYMDVNNEVSLPDEIKFVVDKVVYEFGRYNGYILRDLTHKEAPWNEAREGLQPEESSKNIISEETIRQYFTKVNQEFDLRSENGTQEYIKSLNVI